MVKESRIHEVRRTSVDALIEKAKSYAKIGENCLTISTNDKGKLGSSVKNALRHEGFIQTECSPMSLGENTSFTNFEKTQIQ